MHVVAAKRFQWRALITSYVADLVQWRSYYNRAVEHWWYHPMAPAQYLTYHICITLDDHQYYNLKEKKIIPIVLNPTINSRDTFRFGSGLSQLSGYVRRGAT
jgi:hypothetical protein